MSKNIEIIIGTYEEFLVGYKLDYKNDEQVLVQSFADKSHTGSIKCLGVHGKYIATGGTDDRIFIYDMKIRKQSQILLSHEGTVNSIAFSSDDTHILSAGDDGRMVAVRLNTWQVGANWKKAHGGAAVTHISCHPSGKMALSLGSDLVLNTWNLVKGRVAYKTNLKSRSSLGGAPDCLSWSPTGDYFCISGQRVVEIWCIKKADVLRSEKTKSKPICVCWVSDDLLVAGLEDGSIIFVSTELGKEVKTVNAHKSRVKAMAVLNDIVVSASSSGDVKMWTVDVGSRELVQIATTNIGCRPTCIGILDLNQFGSDYDTKNVPIVKEDTVKLKVEAPVSQQRGVVTIEYDEDNDKEDPKADDIEDNDVLNVSETEPLMTVSQKKRKRKAKVTVEGKTTNADGKKKKKIKKMRPVNPREPGAFVRLRK